MANKVYASGERLSTMDDLMNTKEELLDLFNSIEDINKYILIPKLDQNGNLDWKYLVEQLPEDEGGNKIYSWFILPRDKDLGTYNQEGVFTPELGYYNQDTFDYEEDDHVNKKPHGIRLFRIVYMLKSGVWTVDTDLLNLPNAFGGDNSSSMTLGSGWTSTGTEPFSLPSISRYDLVTREDLLSYANKTYVDNNIRNVSNNRIPIRHTNQSPFIIQGKTPGIYHISGFGSNTISMRVGTNSSNITSSSIKDKLIYVVKEYKNLSELVIGDTLAYYFEYSGNTIKRVTLTYDNVYQPGRLCQIENETVASYALPSDLNNYLSKTNTTSYTPTANYHPATKYYVDSKVALPTLTIMPSQMISQTECQLTQEQITLLSDDSIGTIYLIGENLGMLNGVANKASIYTFNDEDYVELLSLYTNPGTTMPKIMRGLCNLTTGIATLSLSGVLPTDNTTEYIPTADYHPATKYYVDINAGQTIQYSTMPTASEETVGRVVQYVGATDQNYTNGYFYIATANTPEDSADPTTYTWEQLEVQPSGGGGAVKDIDISTHSSYSATVHSASYYYYEFDKGIYFIHDSITDTEGTSSEVHIALGNYNSNVLFARLPFLLIISQGNNTMTYNFTVIGSVMNNKDARLVVGEIGSPRLRDSGFYVQGNVSKSYFLKDVITDYSNSSSHTYTDNETFALSTVNTKAYTPTANYHPATKKYVDDNKGSDPYIVINYRKDSNETILEKMQGWYNAYIQGKTIDLYYASYFSASAVSPDRTIKATNINVDLNQGTLEVDFTYQIYNTSTILNNDIWCERLCLSIEENDTLSYPRWVGFFGRGLYSYDYKRFGSQVPDASAALSLTNTYSYTPTGDYNPATKKYVDDTVIIKAYQLAGLTEYDDTDTYDTGDYCYYQNAIYKCKADNTTGTWDSTKWDTKTYMEYMSDILIGGALGGGY